MIRLLLADDHTIVRNGLKQIMAGTTDIVVAGEASSGAEVLEIARKIKFDLLLLDLNMPGVSGPDLIRRVLAENQLVRILVLSMHNESQVVSRALQAGACGYVTKDSDQEILISAIRAVAAGGKFIDPALVEAMVFGDIESNSSPHNVLSDRELQVLHMVAAGHKVGAIADTLYLSAKTISTHKANLMQKLNIKNNADLVRYAIRHNLVMK